MIRIRTGKVLSITNQKPGKTEIEVELEGSQARALNYDRLTGSVEAGDAVLLNTTAVTKKLGTGGIHFVMANLSRLECDAQENGHIMKMRYSPAQVKVLSVEEEESPYAGIMSRATSLAGTPVIVGTLHSMLAPAAAAVYGITGGNARVVYLMTDGAALPLPLSNVVCQLKDLGLIHATVTCGHAFGGDLEAVTIYSALLAAKAVAGADIIIVTMGPGIVGTASRFGFSGVEQGEIVNAVNILSGRPVAIPRISFADQRKRHYGLSHHTRTALGEIALTPCQMPFPVMSPAKTEFVRGQLKEAGLIGKHRIVEIDGKIGLQVLRELGIQARTMGRSVQDDPEFFQAASAAGILAASLL